jgi:hypothetical protein
VVAVAGDDEPESSAVLDELKESSNAEAAS